MTFEIVRVPQQEKHINFKPGEMKEPNTGEKRVKKSVGYVSETLITIIYRDNMV